jgi:hypothetical protein
MSDIYEQHKKAFHNVEAFVVVQNGERIATVAFKFPADGAGRLYAYVHIFGGTMVRGFASGGGYDKRSAAFYAACAKIKTSDYADQPNGGPAQRSAAIIFKEFDDQGRTWQDHLRAAGFSVFQAV